MLNNYAISSFKNFSPSSASDSGLDASGRHIAAARAIARLRLREIVVGASDDIDYGRASGLARARNLVLFPAHAVARGYTRDEVVGVLEL